MPRNLSTRLSLKTLLNESVYQRTVALLIRRRNLKTRTISLISSSVVYLSGLFLFICIAATANGIPMKQTRTMEIELGNRIANEEQLKVMKPLCRSCMISRLMSINGALERSDVLSTPSESQNYSNITKILRHTCRGLSYSKCRHLYQQIINLKQRFKNLSAEKESTKTTFSNQRRVIEKRFDETPTLYNVPELPSTTEKILSRSKRLAKSDRRLVHMRCKTGFTLQINQDGSVIGNRGRPSSALLEIQSVKPGGVIRFYSRSTGLYLAMNKGGRLYGTRRYSDERCAFVERLQENLYSTYSAYLLPRKRRRPSRSAKKPWYIGIGRSGKPRKGSKIKPTSRAALFLPLRPR